MAMGDAGQYFEATFLTEHAVARADIIRRAGEGWAIIEVKSGKSPAPDEAVQQEHLDDVAYTVMVAQEAGVLVVRATLLLVNRDYRLGMPEAARFVELDVTAEVLPRAAARRSGLPGLAAQVTADTVPAPTLIPACKQCDYFTEHCLGRDNPDPIFLLPHLRGKRFEALAPFGSISRLPLDVDLTDNQREVFEVLRTGVPKVHGSFLQGLEGLEWPAHYLDFETVMPALPWHEGEGPYTTILSQYSLHVVERSGEPPRHMEYLAVLDRDWRRELLESLLDALGSRGSVVVYSTYERVQLEQAARMFPDLEPRLAQVIRRIFDLEPYFRKGYVHPGFRGSSSIKKVLPVMVPELSYTGMPVAGGGDASGLVGLMKTGQVPAAEHERHRRDLLQYCKLDTLAMVRLHQALLEVLRAQ